jgi:sulfatase maturation enzyme AslB (radical SAM superfamily)
MRAVSGLLAVSLDGPNADVHEVLRGKKTFASAYASFVKGLNYLGGDRVILSCLLSRALLPQIDELWDFAQQHGVGVLYLDLFEPLRSYRRSPQAPEIRELIAPVLHLLDKAERQGRPRLLFSESHDLIDVQAAFSSRDVKKILGRTIKVQADGWALPGPFYYDACFRLGRPAEHGWPPILNSAVYHHLKELAITRKQMVEACGRCFWSHRCGGGSLALTWATYGHWTAACPLCELYQATLERAARRQMSHESALFARKPSFGAGARA